MQQPLSPLAQRTKPAGALLIGLALLALTAFMVLAMRRYILVTLFFGCAVTLPALFGVVVGQPNDPYGNRPTWYRLSIAACAFAGLLIAFVVHLQLQFE
jgi:hypothetical protein